jgi:predicted nuclease with RNAse H fold
VPDALATILDLAANSPADNVKLKAATEILDRAGIKTAEELNVTVEVGEINPAATLAERLSKLKKAADLSAEMQRRNDAAVADTLALTAVPTAVIDTDGEIIEGEVVATTDTDGGGNDGAVDER